MTEFRCKKCHKLLFRLSLKGEFVIPEDAKPITLEKSEARQGIETKCPKCKEVNFYTQEVLVGI